MSVRSHLKLISAAGASALMLGLVAAPSGAAVPTMTATGVKYSCFNGAINAAADVSLQTPTSTTLVAGQKESLLGSITVKLPHGATDLMLGTLHWDSFTGTVTAPVPTKTVGLQMTAPLTPVGTPPGTAGSETDATATGNATLDYPAAGSYSVSIGNFTATLQGYKSGSKTGSPVAIGCLAPTDGTNVLKDGSSQPVAITVSKDASKTTAKAAYAKAKHVVTASAHVKGKTYGLIGSGKVKFLLKHGTKTISKAVALNKKGNATFKFKNITKKGKYTLTAKYGGNGGLKSSSSTVHFTI
jgi:hypothetical protein